MLTEKISDERGFFMAFGKKNLNLEEKQNVNMTLTEI